MTPFETWWEKEGSKIAGELYPGTDNARVELIAQLSWIAALEHAVKKFHGVYIRIVEKQ